MAFFISMYDDNNLFCLFIFFYLQPPSKNINGYIVGYRIKYQQERGQIQTKGVGKVTKFILTSLDKNTQYTVWMAVRNNVGFGPWTTTGIKTKTFADGKM